MTLKLDKKFIIVVCLVVCVVLQTVCFGLGSFQNTNNISTIRYIPEASNAFNVPANQIYITGQIFQNVFLNPGGKPLIKAVSSFYGIADVPLYSNVNRKIISYYLLCVIAIPKIAYITVTSWAHLSDGMK